MDREVCDYYESISKKDNLCRYFTGRVNSPRDKDRCRYHCTIMESKRMMEEGEVMVRHRGALRKK